MSTVHRTVSVIGGFGFLGWHLACRLKATRGLDPVRLGRRELDNPAGLAGSLSNEIVHLAGVNRAGSDALVEQGNITAATVLASAVRARGIPVDLCFANSIHSQGDSAYGRGKRAAAEILGEAVDQVGGRFADVLLPNLFGEHGRPHYNSFVATFAHQVSRGCRPTVTNDIQVPLMHAQDAAAALLDALGTSGRSEPTTELHGVAEVATRLQRIHELYAAGGQLPDLGTAFDVDLFNTYRAAAWESQPYLFPMSPVIHADDRGELFETVRAHGGTGQAFVSMTRPGRVRGDHYHLRKVERFFVARGEAEIRVRRLLHDEVTTFRLTGDRPSFVDMPTLWTHNIRNVGKDELVTMFWADQLLDPENPDQFAEKVELT